MNKIKLLLIPLVAAITIAVTMPPASAQPAQQIQNGVNSIGGSGAPSLGSQVKIVINVLLFILGAISVIMIVIGGIRYTTANGDSGHLKTARDTIIYAVVGVVVALLAYALVNFVITSFT